MISYRVIFTFIGIFGFVLSIVFLDLLNVDNVFSIQYFIGMGFGVLFLICVFTYKEKEEQVKLDGY